MNFYEIKYNLRSSVLMFSFYVIWFVFNIVTLRTKIINFTETVSSFWVKENIKDD
jgi:hypothetical protein